MNRSTLTAELCPYAEPDCRGSVRAGRGSKHDCQMLFCTIARNIVLPRYRNTYDFSVFVTDSDDKSAKLSVDFPIFKKTFVRYRIERRTNQLHKQATIT